MTRIIVVAEVEVDLSSLVVAALEAEASAVSAAVAASVAAAPADDSNHNSLITSYK